MIKSEALPRKCYLQVPGMDIGTEDGQAWTHVDADKYTAAIELSNKCRDFYKSRLEAANTIKAKWRNSLSDGDSAPSSASTSPTSSSSSISSQEDEKAGTRQKSGIDAAMERLRAEVVSFIDQDLSLMKQLLTLNETIEELKWQHQYYSCSTSCASLSSSKLLDSNWSVSDTEMYEADDDLVVANHATTGAPQSGTVTGPTWHSTRKTRKACKDLENLTTDSTPSVLDIIVDVSVDNCSQHNLGAAVCCESHESMSNLKYVAHAKPHSDTAGQSVIHHDRDQNSFDSGIHEDLVWAI